MADLTKGVLFVISILISLLIFGVGIYGSWVVDTNGGAKPDCWQLWPNALVNCILDYIFGFVMFCYSFGILAEASVFGKCLGFCITLFGYHIWTMVINENITEKCAQSYKDDYPELWNYFKLEVAMFYVYVAVLGFALFISIIACCGSCCQPEVPHSRASNACINDQGELTIGGKQIKSTLNKNNTNVDLNDAILNINTETNANNV